MQALLDTNDLILIEAAVVERLRRDTVVELHPRLVHAGLICEETGRRQLAAIYREYIDVARRAQLPLLLCTPTWRANRERVEEAGIETDIHADAVRFMAELRAASGAGRPTIRIGGLIGCMNDCYRPEEGLSARNAEQFHAWQINRLASAGVDFLIAETLPNVEEAAGIAAAMAASGTPYIISFVIGRGGCVLDGTPLSEAFKRIDGSTATRPLGFMVNCAHPDFLNAAAQPRSLFDRLIGYQANASSLDHADLDGRAEESVGDIPAWGDAMLALNRRYGVKILGGCCGTGTAHLAYIADGGEYTTRRGV